MSDIECDDGGNNFLMICDASKVYGYTEDVNEVIYLGCKLPS